MLSLIYCLMLYIITERTNVVIGKWGGIIMFSLALIIDLAIEICGLIALYNLFTRL